MGVLVHGLKSHSNAWGDRASQVTPTNDDVHGHTRSCIDHHPCFGRVSLWQAARGYSPDICDAVQPKFARFLHVGEEGDVVARAEHPGGTKGLDPRPQVTRSSDHHVVSSGDVLHPRVSVVRQGFCQGAYVHAQGIVLGEASDENLAHLARELPTSRIQVLMAISWFPS